MRLNEITARSVPNAIRTLVAQYARDGRAASAYEVNDGSCEDFASELEEMFPQVEAMEVASFKDDDGIDLAVLARHWPGTQKPHDLTWGEMNAIPARHIWVYDSGTGLHHDAEAADGVKSLFDLPFFQRHIEQYRRVRTTAEFQRGLEAARQGRPSPHDPNGRWGYWAGRSMAAHMARYAG